MAVQVTLEAFRNWGAEGGRKSRRTLTAEQGRMMAMHSAAARRNSCAVATTDLPGSRVHPHGTQEWAVHNVNIQSGCEHDCLYCYAKSMAIRFKRVTATCWAEPKPLGDINAERFGPKQGRIMFPTTHDITPGNLVRCADALDFILGAGNQVLVVTKPHLACVEELCRRLGRFRSQVLFRFTVGSTTDDVLRYWEPHAPGFDERLDSLKHAFFAAFSTSVSIEPMLDDHVDAVIAAVRSYVTDAIWVGRVNQLPSAIALNCPDRTDARLRARALLAVQNDDWVRSVYQRHRADAKVKWKDSVKKVVGLQRPTRMGLDV